MALPISICEKKRFETTTAAVPWNSLSRINPGWLDGLFSVRYWTKGLGLSQSKITKSQLTHWQPAGLLEVWGAQPGQGGGSARCGECPAGSPPQVGLIVHKRAARRLVDYLENLLQKIDNIVLHFVELNLFKEDAQNYSLFHRIYRAKHSHVPSSAAVKQFYIRWVLQWSVSKKWDSVREWEKRSGLLGQNPNFFSNILVEGPLVSCATFIHIISIQIRDEFIIARCYIILFWIWCAHLTSRLTDGKSGALQVLMRWREKKPVLTGRARGRLAHLAAYSPRRVKTINCAGNTSGKYWAKLDVNCSYGKSNTFRMFPCEFVILLSILSSSAIMFVQLISDHLTKDVALSKHQLETRETSASERGPCTIYCHLEKIFIPPDR